MSVDKHQPLSPSVEALLDSVRSVDPAPEELRTRALARARATASLTALAPRVKPSFGGLGLKLAAAFIVAATLVSAAAFQLRAAHKPAPAAPAASALPHEAPSAVAPEAAPVAETVTPDPSATADDSASPQPVPIAPAHTAHERYALELKVLQPARAAVARGDFSAALSSIAEHRRRFPDGQLSEEREALRVQALSGLGRTEEATRAASAFRKRFPGSVLISRMQALRQAP
ncbi:MAG TPA: hypothetical protein VHW01_18160 [Polyangiaceae bacterium]|nr:hypothetical protein [Polyangiaceae bacterium]